MMLKVPRIKIAEATASHVLNDLNLSGPRVDPIAIAEHHDILVQPKPPYNDGYSGMLACYGETFGIQYATYIDNPGFQRFSVAHELGHFFLSGHVEKVLEGGAHSSRGGFISSDPYEQEADAFAAALLMPEPCVLKIIRRLDAGMGAVQKIANDCDVSLTAAAIKYAKLTNDAVAAVLTTDGVINFCSFSDPMKDMKVKWLRPGTPIPAGTMTSAFGADQSNIDAAREDASSIDLANWFEGTSSHPASEQVVGLGSYGKVLTVIYSERLSAQAQGYDDEDPSDEELMESWTPRFRR